MNPRFIRISLSFAVVAVLLAVGWVQNRGTPRQPVQQASGLVNTADLAEHRTLHSDAEPEVRASDSGDQRPQLTNGEVEKIRAELATLEPVLPGEVENEVALELLRRWAALDPQSAIEYAASHPGLHGRADLAAELFILWRNANDAEPMRWLAALPSGDLRTQLMPIVISAIAERQPEQALEMALTLADEPRKRAIAAAFSKWAAFDPIAAVMQARRLPGEEEQALALRQAVNQWAERDFNSAVQWVKRLPHHYDPGTSDPDLGVLEALLDQWTANAPKDAAGYLLSNQDITKRVPMLGAVARQWAAQNPTEVLQWAASVRDEGDRNLVVKSALAMVAPSNMETAANLALTISPGTTRQQGIAFIFDQWMAADPAAIPVWTTSLLNKNIQQDALDAVVSAWAGSAMQSLGQWLSTLPPGPGHDASCAAFARHLAPTQPAVAAEWANAISNPVLRQEHLNRIATLNK